jgi:ABC-type Na+ efflux pump permease subunit
MIKSDQLIKLDIGMLKMNFTSFCFMSSNMNDSQNIIPLYTNIIPMLANISSSSFAPFFLFLLLLTFVQYREIFKNEIAEQKLRDTFEEKRLRSRLQRENDKLMCI